MLVPPRALIVLSLASEMAFPMVCVVPDVTLLPINNAPALPAAAGPAPLSVRVLAPTT